MATKAHGSPCKRLGEDAARGLATGLTWQRKAAAALASKPRISAKQAAVALARNPLTQDQREEIKAACAEANPAFAIDPKRRLAHGWRPRDRNGEIASAGGGFRRLAWRQRRPLQTHLQRAAL